MENKTNKVLVFALGVLLALALGLLMGFAIKPTQEVPTAAEIAAEVKIPAAVAPTAAPVDSNLSAKVDAIDAKISSLDEFEEEADEKLQNDTAKSLVLAEMAKRDFKKEVLAVLESNTIDNKSVEDYKDLTIYSVKIDEVELNDDETAEVIVTFKVSGFEDADEESDFKARLTATFVVEGLDVDELDEAEIADTVIALEKFYD